MPKRNYSNTAPPLPLSVALTASGTTATVSSTAGYPEAPFLIGLERGTANEEVVLCTALTPTAFTITRGYDGTTAKAHGVGTMVEHTVAAIDYREGTLTPMTIAERNALTGSNLYEGLVVSNTDTNTVDVYHGAVWYSLIRSDDARLADTRPPSGAAGGDLTGTYPNPTLAADSVGTTEVAAANKDGAAGTPSMRTLGTGATQAAAGSHLHDDRYFTEAEATNTFAPKASPAFTGTPTGITKAHVGLGNVHDARQAYAYKGGNEMVAAASGTSGTVTLNCDVASVFTLTPSGDVTTLAISNPSASGTSCTITLIVTQGGTPRTIATPANGSFYGASSPAQVANKKCIFTYLTTDAGATWICSGVVQI